MESPRKSERVEEKEREREREKEKKRERGGKESLGERGMVTCPF